MKGVRTLEGSARKGFLRNEQGRTPGRETGRGVGPGGPLENGLCKKSDGIESFDSIPPVV